ncbi:MAG: 50S ribosomal protein L11 methyltransferase [Rhodospirillaceae bacterium]|nr:50S ribosomal protein L11 methyltransferase [Rhodospirillaceae bacterium]
MVGPADSFIAAHTALEAPPACPEIRLHLATEITPMWQATEDFLTRHNLPPPYWAFAWAGGQAVARFLLDNPEWVAGKSVLDFAAGSGLVAIAAAKAGAAKVETAEIDPMANAAIALNAAANGVAVTIWDGDVLDQTDMPWDVIAAGDVCYERPMAERVLAWLKRCRDKGATIILGDPGRTYLPGSGLVRLGSYTIPCSLELEDRTSREAAVYTLERPAE